ncbi:hypothetical protein Ancab_011300 [Ancistrocladus abbreviatus]
MAMSSTSLPYLKGQASQGRYVAVVSAAHLLRSFSIHFELGLAAPQSDCYTKLPLVLHLSLFPNKTYHALEEHGTAMVMEVLHGCDTRYFKMRPRSYSDPGNHMVLQSYTSLDEIVPYSPKRAPWWKKKSLSLPLPAVSTNFIEKEETLHARFNKPNYYDLPKSCCYGEITQAGPVCHPWRCHGGDRLCENRAKQFYGR